MNSLKSRTASGSFSTMLSKSFKVEASRSIMTSSWHLMYRFITLNSGGKQGLIITSAYFKSLTRFSQTSRAFWSSFLFSLDVETFEFVKARTALFDVSYSSFVRHKLSGEIDLLSFSSSVEMNYGG